MWNQLPGYAVVCTCLLVPLARAEEAITKLVPPVGTIRQVTLYRNSALVTREIAVPPGEPSRTLDVPDLPELMIANSVYADGDESTVVRAVRVSNSPAVESQRQEVRDLDRQLEELKQQRAELQVTLGVIAKNIESLDQLCRFSSAAGQVDLNRGVLNAETLTGLTTFSMNQHRELAGEQLRCQTQLEKVGQQFQLTEARREQATGTPSATRYETKIFVETPGGAAGKVYLSYQVGNCGWTPQYTVRGRSAQRTFELRYSALVRQMSGEDWKEVTLTLSTASPSLAATRPLLTPLHIVSVDPTRLGREEESAEPPNDPFEEPAVDDQADEFAGMVQALREQQQATEAEPVSDPWTYASDERDLALNSLANRLQEIELKAASRSWRTLAPDVNEDLGIQVYALSQPVSLDTRREQQLVQILEKQLAGEVYHVATPLLSTYAYREAELTNTQPCGLLGGPATVYLDERFVGCTQIPSTASGQSLTIGCGADQQVRTRRELRDKQDQVQGGNRQLKFVYRLVLSNFKDEPVAVRLVDRMPVTRQTQQLSVRLDDPQLPISDDGLYQRVLRPVGLLRWDLIVPAGRHGSQAFDVQYSYTVEFDRNLTPATQQTLAELRTEYQDMRLPAGGMGGMGGGR
jgi:hypothetical protein